MAPDSEQGSAFLHDGPPYILGQMQSVKGLHPGEEEVEYDPEPLEEDMYGVGITSLLRDARKLVLREGRLCLRCTRASITLLLLWGTIALQAFMIWEFKTLVTQAYVHTIRLAYSDYEAWMYENHTRLTVNGFDRGIPGYFNGERFKDLPEHVDKDLICKVPLSRPGFFAAVLSIWAFTVVNDIRKIQFHMDLMLIRTDTVESADSILQSDYGNKTVTLMGLTRSFKAMLFFSFFLPRIIIDLYLLWIGSRWLTATASFSDLLLNAMGLEFILLLKDLVYHAVVPARDKFETRTFLVPSKQRQKATWCSYLGAFLWLLAVLVWVLVYVYKLQEVLPDYQFDIAGVCSQYLEEHTALVKQGRGAALRSSASGDGLAGGHRAR